jgi:purine-cytosine permease-like protein
MFLLGNFIIIIFGVWFHKKFYNIIPNEIFKLSIALVVVMPIILYSYYIFHEIESVREHKSYKDLLEESEAEIKAEEKTSSIIPVILFGVGIVYGNIEKLTKNKDIIKIAAPFLIFSLLFGTVIPNMVSYLILDHHDLHRVLVASDVNFFAISISFGLMITSLLIPFLVHY